MNRLIIEFLIMAFSIYIVGKVTRLFEIADFFTALLTVLVLAAVNAVVRPILVFLTLPISILTLGLFLFLINGFCLILASKFIPKIKVEGCFSATVASILISIINMLLENILGVY